MRSGRGTIRALGLGVSLAALLAIAAGHAETVVTQGLGGGPGLVDMPTGEANADGQVTVGFSAFGGISRTSLNFQIAPWVSGSFRYTGVRRWDDVVASDFPTYYDRSFDLRFHILKEGDWQPAVTVGLNDFIGTGLQSGEYVAATKTFRDGTVKVTAGLGWGRLGSYGAIAAPFGSDRDTSLSGDTGGNLSVGQWFRGDMAPFAGIEWQVNDRLGLKVEYSSDDYTREAQERQVFDRRSPLNFGVEYQATNQIRLGAYYLYGSELGLAAHIALNPYKRPTGGIIDNAPFPMEVRPARASDPDAWSPEWTDQPGVGDVLRKNLETRLEDDGIRVEAIGFTGNRAQLRVSSTRYDAEAQIIGRAARALTQVMPASVETFEIVPMVRGIPAAAVVVQRSDLERLEFSPDLAGGIAAAAVVTDAAPLPALVSVAEPLPRFRWSVTPYVRTSLFDPDQPFRGDLGLRGQASFDIAPNLVLSGSLTHKLVGNLDQSDRVSNSVLPRVRSDVQRYNQADGLLLEKLTLAWYTRPARNLYGRVTAGYLERMYGGVSGELLWKPPESRLALGVEVNYARQRDFDQQFGFRDYSIATGHVSAYYNFGDEYLAQVDVGRYLAGDVGATLTLTRQFANGWQVGAFATKTNVSAEDFGEGSFDKGIRVTIPLNWMTGLPSQTQVTSTIRPVTRDGGARLDVDGRLYETVRSYHDPSMDNQWGRFWR
jgi:hypothetical protein